MKRVIFNILLDWIKDTTRKPLILRGARQVGKSYLVKELGKRFDYFIEINFEHRPNLRQIFHDSLEVEEIIKKLVAVFETEVIPGKTLIFFDEIQLCPNAITALRYFYEQMPRLHVIAAGSLIEFKIEEVGIPVGRVRSIYIYPMTFEEFLFALHEEKLLNYLNAHNLDNAIDETIHNQLLRRLAEYFVVGGMPEAVQAWVQTKNMSKVQMIHNDLIDTFRQDFGKYSKQNQIKYVEKIFNSVPRLSGKKFIFQTVDSSLRARELRPALELLEKAQIIHIISHSSSNGVPLAATTNETLFKVIFLDIGLMQTMLGVDLSEWMINFNQTLINKGEVAEAFIGLEILGHSNPYKKSKLYYWIREKKNASAEVDYVIEQGENIIPLEVKSGTGGKCKSLIQFVKEKKRSFGYHFSQQNFSLTQTIRTVPLYAYCLINKQIIPHKITK